MARLSEFGDWRISRRAILLAPILARIFPATVSPVSADEKGVVKFVPADRDKPQAATIRMKNGLMRSGMCSEATTLAPFPGGNRQVDRQDQKLSMRLIDQKFREIYVPVRQSESPVLDINAWPAQSFQIRRKGGRRIARPLVIPSLEPFDAAGIAHGKAFRPNGEEVPVEAAVVSINELFAEVSSTTHDWQFAVSTKVLPRQNLLSILSQVDDYQTSMNRRLELVRMLVKADRIPEAGFLLQTLSDFPDAANLQTQQLQRIREETARQITSVLETRRDVGQHRIAANGAKLHPKNDLTPDTVVRVETLVKDYETLASRIDRVRQALPMLAAKIADESLRTAIQQVVREVADAIDEDSIDRFAAFELQLSTPEADRPDAETQLATALSGWLLGAENTVATLIDVRSLFDAKLLVLDYLDTSLGEEERRRTLAEDAMKLEGVSVDRIAAMVKLLPSVHPVRVTFAEESSAGEIEIAASANNLGAVGIVPPEYHETRRYPLVIAFPGSEADPRQWLDWWKNEAVARGFIVVTPVWPSAEEEPRVPGSVYTASAQFHDRFMGLMRVLKRGLQIDDDRVFVAGHGPGGEAALDMMASHSQLFAGVVSISSTGRRHLQWTMTNAIEKPVYFVIGDAHPEWFDRTNILSARFFRRGEEIQKYFDVMFIKYPERTAENFSEEIMDVFEWMSVHRRQKFPEQLHAKILRSTDLDWGWAKLTSLPPQFAQLDAPSDAMAEGFKPATMNVRLTSRNAIIIEAKPAPMTLYLSPEMPGIDLANPIRIAAGRNSKSIDYQPSLPDLLQRLYETGDRSRLAFMKVDVND
ncbi:MAG: hypothetical protein JNM43_04120 [Planctomycetaceae bacterium]|nr:hypothetical protein [Planctomycetaceae bacterium]